MKNLIKKAWNTIFNKNSFPFKEGENFNVEVTMDEVMCSDGTLQVFLDKIAKALGFDLAEIYFSDNGLYFKVYDPETGEVHIVDEDDNNSHMVDFLGDIQSRRMNIVPFNIRLMYKSIASVEYSESEYKFDPSINCGDEDWDDDNF
mgnify:CR=1 FL=1